VEAQNAAKDETQQSQGAQAYADDKEEGRGSCMDPDEGSCPGCNTSSKARRRTRY